MNIDPFFLFSFSDEINWIWVVSLDIFDVFECSTEISAVVDDVSENASYLSSERFNLRMFPQFQWHFPWPHLF